MTHLQLLRLHHEPAFARRDRRKACARREGQFPFCHVTGSSFSRSPLARRRAVDREMIACLRSLIATRSANRERKRP